MGLRWDYYTPVNEANSLELQPIITNNNAISTLLDSAGEARSVQTRASAVRSVSLMRILC